MAKYFNKALWYQAFRKQDWYVDVQDEFQRLEQEVENLETEARRAIKAEFYAFFEDALLKGVIPLGTNGIDWDKERQPITTVVIHHTRERSGMTLNRLNAMHLIRLYAARYAANNPESDRRGQPIWSNHFHEGRQVFWGYHWLLRLNGQSERLLLDSHIGWHSGKWAVNRQSIGICIDDDLSESQPSKLVIQSLADLINKHYSHVPKESVIGHRQVREDRTCPGELFLPIWRQKLLDCLSVGRH